MVIGQFLFFGLFGMAPLPVTEGFAQGCPVSLLFAAIVLNSILRKIQPMLEARAKERLRNNDAGEDSQSTLGLIMAYVDDVNILLHHEDVEFFGGFQQTGDTFRRGP